MSKRKGPSKKNKKGPTNKVRLVRHLYVFLDDDTGAKIADWFHCPEIYENGCFKIPMDWRIPNTKSKFTFAVSPPRGRWVGQDDNYAFYLRHILVTDTVLSNSSLAGVFLILLDLRLELLPHVKKQVEAAAERGENIDYLTIEQPSYNVLCPVWQ